MKRHRKRQVAKVVCGGITVRVYPRQRPGGYRCWEVADYSSGARKLRSFADEAAAFREAERIARLMAAGEVHGATMHGRDAASMGRALELLRPTGVPLELVAAHFAEAFEVLGGNRIVEAAKDFARRNAVAREPRTVAEAVAELVKVREGRSASLRYIEDLRQRLGRVAAAFRCSVASVTTSDLQAWLDGLKAAPRSVRNYRNAAFTLFEFAKARGYTAENPVAGTERVSARTTDPVTIFTPAEMLALLHAAEPGFRPVLALGAFAGLRSAEIARLDWREIDLGAGGHVEVAAAKAKTATRRLVPVTDALRAWLGPHARKAGLVWPHTRAYLHECQHNTATRAGVGWKQNALRHSFISYRVAAVQNVAQVALEAGNSPQMIFANYRAIVKPADAERWFDVRPESPANVLPLAVSP